MSKSRRHNARPVVESMEPRTLLSTARPAAQVSVINPGIVAGSPGSPGVVVSEAPRTLQIVVMSQAGVHPFAPLASLVPGTIRVDGIAFRGVTVRPLPDSNGDGIPDAVVTIPTRGLRLPDGLGILTVSGTIRAGAGHPVVWTSATTIDVLAAGEGGGFLQYQGYINLYNNTSGIIYETLSTNTPPGGTPAAGSQNTIYPGVTQLVYTGPGQPNQLAIVANLSLVGYTVFPQYTGTWYSGNMTIATSMPSNIITWNINNPSGTVLTLSTSTS